MTSDPESERLAQQQISQHYVRISKYLSKHLRHQPERLGLELNMTFKVGGRRGKSVIFLIDTLSMVVDGYSFYCTENDVWLVDTVPPQYLNQIAV
jgi:putative RNA 2'-phosphotransferase